MEGILNQPDFVPCPACGVPLQAEVFPALFRTVGVGQSAERLMIEGESSCFYHPQKKAVLPCDGCGRFLCALCDCLLHGQHFCPACLEAGRTKGKIKSLENQRTLYDNTALTFALLQLPLIITVVLPPVAGGAAIFVAIRYWKAPQSIAQSAKIRFISAICLGGIGIAVWIAYIILRYGHA
jgi:hypothetical protein